MIETLMTVILAVAMAVPLGDEDVRLAGFQKFVRSEGDVHALTVGGTGALITFNLINIRTEEGLTKHPFLLSAVALHLRYEECEQLSRYPVVWRNN